MPHRPAAVKSLRQDKKRALRNKAVRSRLRTEHNRFARMLARGDVEAAAKSFEQALKLLEREDPIVARHLGDAYRSVSRFGDALESYRRALALGPEEEEIAEIERQIELLELQLSESSEAAR